jgi:hypothetical protein
VILSEGERPSRRIPASPRRYADCTFELNTVESGQDWRKDVPLIERRTENVYADDID